MTAADISAAPGGDVADPRRQRPIDIRWVGMIGRLYVDGEFWGAVEWSDKRKAFCIEDAGGKCLTHKHHIHGAAAAKDEAVELAKAMIADGRMPSPQEARKAERERRAANKARRDATPSGKRRLELREQENRLFRADMHAESADRDAPPLYEVFADAFDLTDKELWRSNSFAMLRARLVLSVKAVIADLEHSDAYGRRRYGHGLGEDDERRLARAREILAKLESAP